MDKVRNIKKLLISIVKKVGIYFLYFIAMTDCLFALEAKSIIKIGVLANNGIDKSKKTWQPTIDYLNKHLPYNNFQLVPLHYSEMTNTVHNKKIDLVLCNSSQYVELAYLSDLRIIATLKENRGSLASEFNGSVIFTRSDNHSIYKLEDLIGKSFVAPDKKTFAGWIMTWKELFLKEIDPFKDFKSMNFVGSHDSVVYSVLSKKADAGSVRTGILEKFVNSGQIKLKDFRVINEDVIFRNSKDYKLFLSTPLYPSWPLSKVSNISNETAQQIAIALLSMIESDSAAIAGNYSGWVVPMNYSKVEECLKDLKIGHYQQYGEVTEFEAIRQHLPESIAFFIMIIFCFLLIILQFFNLKRQKNSKLLLEQNLIFQTRLICDKNNEIELRKGIEQSLRDSEEILNVTTNSAMSVIIIIDNFGKVLLWNNAAENIFHYTKEEAIGQLVSDLIIPEKYRTGHNNGIDSFSKTGAGNAIGKLIEITAINKSKYEFPIELSLSSFKHKNLWYAVGIINDITERKLSEEAFRISEMKFRTLYDSTSDAVMLVNENGFFDCNSATLDIFGIATKEEFCLKHPGDLSPLIQPDGNDSKSLSNQLIRLAMENGNHRFEWIHKRADNGILFPAEVLFSAMVLDGKKILQAVVRDISERRQSEEEQLLLNQNLRELNELIEANLYEKNALIEELSETKDNLEKSNAEKAKFFSIIAHDLKSPLGSLKNLSKLLFDMQDTLSKEEQYEFIEALKESSANVSNLVENLLTWSRLSMNKIEFLPRNQSITVIINDVVSLLSQSTKNKEIRLTNLIKEDLYLSFDENMISLVFRNLISNSIKFTPKGGEIIIMISDPSKQFDNDNISLPVVIFAVSDTGLGMSRNSINNLFRIDVNQSTKGTENEAGTGLGLVLCKEFLDKHRGKIWVESEIGKGSTFYFSLIKND